MVNFPLLLFFSLSLVPIGARAATSQNVAGMPKTPEECKQPAGKPGVNGYMPRGVTDENLKDYQDPSRCEANSGRPIDSDTCRKGMEKLFEVASELNRMVKKNCEEFIPKFTSDPEVMNCIAAQAKKSQSGCTGSALKTLSEVNPVIREFKEKLKRFKSTITSLQKKGILVSGETVQVIEESKNAEGTAAFTVPSASAQKMGLNTLKETQEFHSSQDPLVAKALLAEFQNQFENSEERYADVNPANYSQKIQPIDQSWQKVNAVQSRMLREQMNSFLNAEELKLATKLYENQLQEVDAQITKQTEINSQALNSLGAVDPAMMSSFPSASGNSGSESDSSGIGASPAYEMHSGLGKSSNFGKSYASLDSKMNQQSGSQNTNPQQDSSVYGSGKNSTLSLKNDSKDALRKKLNALNQGGHSKQAEGSGKSADSRSEESSESGAIKKAEDRSLSSMDQGTSKNRDVALAGFAGENLLDSEFQMHGESSDDSVQAIVDGFYAALGEQQLENAGIGNADDVSLFLRVREFHEKCLKLGCVTGVKSR